MWGIPLSVAAERGPYFYGLETLEIAFILDSEGTNDHQYRAPVLSDYDNMYGLIAQSIPPPPTTPGNHGVVEVLAIGSGP
jgi:hypothetical protein